MCIVYLIHRSILLLSLSITFSLSHVMDWDHARVIGRENNRMDRWMREAIHIVKEQNKSMN